VTDANALGQRRRGRRPKANKRVPLSLLVDADLRTQIVEMAEESDCSITGQVERLLQQGIKTTCIMLHGPIQLDNIPIFSASNISARAGAFLEANYPGRGKDERIAHDLGISAGMAKMLRRGRAWTVGRIDQCMALWPGFRDFVFPPSPSDHFANRLEQLAAGFARLADEVAELRQEFRAERPLRDGARDEPAKDQAE
jgi:hypothetical protein